MPEPRTTSLGRIEIRDVAGEPMRFEGMALPYNQVIEVSYGRERFVRGAFADAVQAINSGERVAYLNRHGADGGVPVGVINSAQERSDGLWFAGDYIDVPETPQARSQVQSGINGVSVEFVPGKYRRKGDVVEHYAGVRLAAIAGSYAPAYRQARVSLRSVARATERIGTVPNLTVAALTERRDSITSQIGAVRAIAESENRALDDTETGDIETLNGRLVNVDALIADARIEEQRRDAERRSLPARAAGGAGGTGAIITRSESVYGPHTQASYFADLMTANRDAAASERLSRHKMLVVDLANQMNRAVDSSDIAGAYPVQNYPDLYVPDIAYSGPLSAFFAVTPITAPNPISLPTFSGVTGDTDVQTAENAALANVDVATAPKALTPKTIGGETIVSRQAVDGASPGTDVIISNQLRELLMRDTEREIALVLEALPTSGAIPDTAGVTPAASGRDLHKGIAGVLGQYYAGAAAGGAGARMLPAEGVFVNSKDWGNLTAGEDASGRPMLAYINPVNALGQLTAPGFQRGVIGGVIVEPAWALLAATNEVVARKNDARQWKSAILDIRLVEREGPQSIVFAIWQYFAFAVLEPKGVRRYTYTNV
jgi:HK97 family phage prohead protease/HK97 family phage major capsid protein